MICASQRPRHVRDEQLRPRFGQFALVADVGHLQPAATTTMEMTRIAMSGAGTTVVRRKNTMIRMPAATSGYASPEVRQLGEDEDGQRVDEADHHLPG